MIVYYDEKEIKIEEVTDTIELLCKHLNIDKEGGVVISVNNLIVPRFKWHDVRLTSTDKIMVISATQGG